MPLLATSWGNWLIAVRQVLVRQVAESSNWNGETLSFGATPSRLVIIVAADDGEIGVPAGAWLEAVTISEDSIHEIPHFIGGLSFVTRARQLFWYEGKVGYLLHPELLVEPRFAPG